MLRSALVLVSFSISATTVAAQVCHSVSVPVAPTNWNQALAIPRFDPVFGTLAAVRVQLAAHLEGSCGVEHFNSAQVDVQVTFSAAVTLTRADQSIIVTANPMLHLAFTLAPFDGVFDFAGPSGFFQSGLSVDVLPPPVVSLSSPADLASFTGPTGSPGSVILNAYAGGTSIAFAGAPLIPQFTSRASCVVTVCYDYVPAVTMFCAGTNATCPCANGGFQGGGCGNSQTSWGASLTAGGTPSVGADDLLLYAANLPVSASTLFFQGTTRVNGGAGAAFGDGLRCAGGAIVRLGVKTAVSGVAAYPGSGDARIALRGGVAAGDVRTYQAWYRDVASWCTADTFNLTQGLEVRWAP